MATIEHPPTFSEFLGFIFAVWLAANAMLAFIGFIEWTNEHTPRRMHRFEYLFPARIIMEWALQPV